MTFDCILQLKILPNHHFVLLPEGPLFRRDVMHSLPQAADDGAGSQETENGEIGSWTEAALTLMNPVRLGP